jgi:cyanophycinase-like exopeptidase
MSGPIGLHGGGEYVAGDEPFLDALLVAAAGSVERRRPPEDGVSPAAASAIPALRRVRVVVVPTAASRGLPDRAAATGVEAFQRRAAATGIEATVEVARVVDAASAADPVILERLAAADLIHLAGGDPDLIPAIVAGTPADAAIRRAWRDGAIVAGASAGAMALAGWTWTPQGGTRGLGFVDGLAVVPHYDEIRRTTWQHVIDQIAPGGIGYLGLDERTGVLAEPNGGGERRWIVTGPGAAWWFERGSTEPLVARSGEVLRIPV